jgi:hypothetical protein
LDIKTVGRQVLVSFLARRVGASYYAGFDRHYWLGWSTNMNPDVWSPVPGYSDIIGADQIVVYTNLLLDTAAFFRGNTWLQSQ